jgi:hypothetical protein
MPKGKSVAIATIPLRRKEFGPLADRVRVGKEKGRLATALLSFFYNQCFLAYWDICSARQPITLTPVIVKATFAEA